MTDRPSIREQQRREEQRRLQRTRQTTATVPIVLFTIFVVLWAIPATREWATGRDERNPVEIITFLAMAVAGILSVRLAARLWRLGHDALITSFFVLFALAAFVVAGDELAWGQVVVDLFRDGVSDAELGLHEIDVLRGRTEWLRLFFAVVGAASVFIPKRSRFRFFKAPTELLPWLVVIGSISLLEVIDNYAALGDSFSDFLFRASELTEMMVAVVVLLYVWERTRDMWFRIP